MTGVVAFALGLLLSLVPPGHQDKISAAKTDTLQLQMPNSLYEGSRAEANQQPRFPTRTSVSPSPARLGEL